MIVLLFASALAGEVPTARVVSGLDAQQVAASERPVTFATFRVDLSLHTLACSGAGETFRCEVSRGESWIGSAIAPSQDGGYIYLDVHAGGQVDHFQRVRFKTSEALVALDFASLSPGL